MALPISPLGVRSTGSVLGDGVTGGDGRQLDRTIPRQTRQRPLDCSSNPSTSCWGEGSSVFSRCRGPRRRAGSCVVAVIPTGRPGARQYMGETGGIFAACQWNSSRCQAPKHSATHSSTRVETASCCCTGRLADGEEHSIDLAVLRAPHAHRAMGLFK